MKGSTRKEREFVNWFYKGPHVGVHDAISPESIEQRTYFCVGGFLASEHHWMKIQDAWVERLKTTDEIPRNFPWDADSGPGCSVEVHVLSSGA
jgi:hypothetical protein